MDLGSKFNSTQTIKKIIFICEWNALSSRLCLIPNTNIMMKIQFSVSRSEQNQRENRNIENGRVFLLLNFLLSNLTHPVCSMGTCIHL